MSRALGVSDSTLRRWRRLEHVDKPGTVATWPHVVQGQEPDRVISVGLADNLRSVSALLSSESRPTTYSGSESKQASAAAQSTWGRPDADAIAAVPIKIGRVNQAASEAVLILTGDPRSGSNHFDAEVGAIRHRLLPGLVTSRHLAVIQLGEIASNVDRYRPTVLHISAHCGDGGVALTWSGQEHFVDPVELAEAIGRADHQPSCVVLGFCRSTAIALRLARTGSGVISWPGVLTDEQGCDFADVFYRQAIQGVPLKRAFDEGRAHMSSRWGVEPTLHTRGYGPLF